MAAKDSSDSHPQPNLGDQPPALKSQHIVALHDILAERAQPVLKRLPMNCNTVAAYVFVKPLSVVLCG